MFSQYSISTEALVRKIYKHSNGWPQGDDKRIGIELQDCILEFLRADL
jgi:hypothetical protein